jgi:dethiobiotin synthetase
VSRARGCFVTGTDTGVGKTLAACAIVRGLRRRGLDVGVMKPIETGVGQAGPLDAIALREAAGVADRLDEVCPVQLALPAAPSAAARHEGRVIDRSLLDRAFERLLGRHDALVVEGAGGLRVPVTDTETMAELAVAWELPLVVVARASLGTINHTRLTLEAAEHAGLEVLGLVVSHPQGPLSSADAANLEALLGQPGATLLGVIPPLTAGELPADDALALDPLLLRLGPQA